MESAIKKWCKNNSYKYVQLPELSIKYVYDLCCHNIINEPTTDLEMLYLGAYYKIQEDYENTKKYYLMAIKKGNSFAIYNLGHYYRVQKDYDNMKKYFLMAIEKGNATAMNNLGYHYHHSEKNYDNMIKYYLMAIENGNSNALANLEDYYNNNCCDVGSIDYTILINAYYKLNNIPKLLESLELYLSSKSEIDIPDKILEIISNIELDKLKNKPIWLRLLIKSIKTQIDTLDLHFKYAPTGEGFNEAKQHYYAELKNT